MLKFNQNNFRMLVVSVFLIFEQLFFAFFVAKDGSELRTVYILSAAVLLCFAASGYYFYNHKPARITTAHGLYEISFTIFGMAVALIRFVFIEVEMLRVPTIYVAVLYGIAVIFVFNLRQGIFCYSIFTAAAVVLLPVINPEISASSFVPDIVSNGLFAWVVLFMNYRNFQRAFYDRKKIEKANAELFEQSIRDGLTGLFNRRKLDDVCREVYLKADRYNLDFTIIMMDIDYFKNINDSSGHAEGDSVLVEISALLAESIREVDVCGRWGGEEFMIISQETGLEEAYMLAERLRVLIEQKLFHGAHKVTSSFGIASYKEFKDLDNLIKAADERLYAAKGGGRNRVEAGNYPPKKG